MTADHREHAEPGNADGSDGETSDPGGQLCWSCGAVLTEGAMFCGECGSAVGARAPRPAEQPEAADGLAEGPGAEPVAEPESSGLPPHGDALIETPAEGGEASAERVPDEDHPTISADSDESGLPPHGDALLDPDAASAWSPDEPDDEPASVVNGDGAHAGADDADDAGDEADEARADEAQPDSSQSDSSQSDSDEPDSGDVAAGVGDGPGGGDSAPTAVQPVLDEADGIPPHGDPVAPEAGAAKTGAGSPLTGFASGVTEPEDDDSVDPLAPLTAEERFAAERLLDPESSADKFVLQFSTGESATVYGSGLVGRNPVAEPGEYVDHFVVIRDPGRSVSKTHLEFGQDDGVFWVLDRFSGNGSVLREPDGAPKRCEPGRRYVVARGTRIEIGDQFFVVS